MPTGLDDFESDKVTEVLNELYDSGEIPEELRSISVALPKCK